MSRPSRRDFLRAGAAAALGAAAQACYTPGPPVTEAPADLGPLTPDLHLYNWSDYIGPDTVAGFEREFGVRVTYDTYESNEELLAKLQAGAVGYDLVVPAGNVVPAFVALGLAQPLSRGYLTNWGNLAPALLDPPFDPGNGYTVPWQWGLTGIAYRRDRVPPPSGWGVFHDAAWRGRMTMLDDQRDVLGAWLKYRGLSLNATDPDQLARARGDAITAKANLRGFKSAPVKGDLLAGDVWIAQLWNGDANQAAAEDDRIAFALPQEGTAVWTDSLLVLASGSNKRTAHEFINYTLRPGVAAGIARATGYGSPNEAAQALLERPVPYPTQDDLLRLEYQLDLGEATGAWDRIWTEVKAA